MQIIATFVVFLLVISMLYADYWYSCSFFQLFMLYADYCFSVNVPYVIRKLLLFLFLLFQKELVAGDTNSEYITIIIPNPTVSHLRNICNRL
jgi:hypothetical protein